MKNKRLLKLLTILVALIIVLIIQTQYIKSEEKLKQNTSLENQTVDISDKVEKDVINQDTVELDKENLNSEATDDTVILDSINENEKKEETLSETQNKVQVKPEVSVKEEVKPVEVIKPEVKPQPVTPKPVVKPEPVVSIKQVEKNVSIDFKTETILDASINKGETKVDVKGVVGNRLVVMQEKYIDGKLVSSEEISNTVTVNPKNQVVRTGTKVPNVEINSDQAKTMFDAMNKSRTEAGKVKLNWSSDLAKAASTRSKEISESFSHTRPNGQKFNTVNPSIVFGENIASASSNALETHQLFMNSAGHRANILDSDFKSVGISTYKIPGKPGATYWTVLFNY